MNIYLTSYAFADIQIIQIQILLQLQWHPEKCSYEYAVKEGTDEFTLNVVHTDERTRMTLEMAEMYVEQYPIIWNHPIAKTEYFEQVFLTDATHLKNLMKSYQGYSLRSKSFNVASKTTIAQESWENTMVTGCQCQVIIYKTPL